MWFGLVSFTILAMLALVALSLAGFFAPSRKQPIVYTLFGGAAIIVAISALAAWAPIAAGHVGVVYGLGGNIVGQLPPGPNFVLPWERVTEVNVQTQTARFHNPGVKSNGDEEKLGIDVYGRVESPSEETQAVYFDLSVNWQITSDQVQGLYDTIGPDFFNKLVPSRVAQYFKDETVKYSAIEATTNREEIRSSVSSALSKELARYGVTIVSIQIDNISYNADFEKAIEEKQVATQKAQTAANQVAIAKAEADRRVAEATGQADSAIQAARGEAESIRLKAQAQADGNRLLNASLTPALIESQRIAKWNGTVPTLVTGNGDGTILDLGSVIR